MPKFSIITPSFRSSKWLRLCVASVADQTGPEHEHIVQDSCSDDDTADWLPHDARVKAFIEKDRGMYDAINRGFKRVSGEILAWLNCDEQYLPGALNTVGQYFDQHPEIDVIFANIIMVDGDGEYLYHRKVQTPLKYHTWTTSLSTLSCATFFRRRVVTELGFTFDPKLRDVGDGEWVLRMLRAGVKMAALPCFTSVFALTGANMSIGANARREALELRRTAPWWAQTFRPGIIWHHRLRRWLGGMYRQEPFAYEIYTGASPTTRKSFAVTHPKFRA
jgi:glycosyltransferase involved in cell wall biosynthesis